MAITFQIDEEVQRLKAWEQERPRILAETLSEYKGCEINWELYLRIKKIKENERQMETPMS